MRPLLALFVLLAACGSPAAEGGTSAPPLAAACTPDYQLTGTPGIVYEDVSSDAVIPWPVEGVTFSVAMRRDGDAARIIGTLANTTDTEVSVDYLTGGVIGLAMNPFDVTVEGTPARRAEGPEVYPTPRRARIPAHGSVTFDLTQCPSAFPARVTWTFSPFRGEAVRGEDTLR